MCNIARDDLKYVLYGQYCMSKLCNMCNIISAIFAICAILNRRTNAQNKEINEEDKHAKAYINASERARAVGKNGLNVHLASSLTGYKISIEDIEETK